MRFPGAGRQELPLCLDFRYARCQFNQVSSVNKADLSLRIDLSCGARIGPGKVRLLELVESTGSISAAGREMNMSYRRAWMLVNSLNESLGTAVVETRKGGSAGGGARLTETGRTVINCYRAMEDKAVEASTEELRVLEALTGHTGNQ